MDDEMEELTREVNDGCEECSGAEAGEEEGRRRKRLELSRTAGKGPTVGDGPQGGLRVSRGNGEDEGSPGRQQNEAARTCRARRAPQLGRFTRVHALSGEAGWVRLRKIDDGGGGMSEEQYRPAHGFTA